MVRTRSLHWAILFVAGLCLSLTGCGSKVSKANFDKINEGMSESDVEALLGKTQAVTTVGGGNIGLNPGANLNIPGANVNLPGMNLNIPSVKTMVWTEGNKTITVSFFDGKV